MTAPSIPPDRTQPPEPEADPTQLDGEPGIPSVALGRRAPLSWKGLLAAALAGGVLLALVGLLVHRAWPGSAGQADNRPARPAAQPTAAGAEPKRLDMSPAPKTAAAPASAPPASATPVIPALQPTDEELAAAPIGIQRNTTHRTGHPVVPPEDAPVMLLSGRSPSTADSAVSEAGPAAPATSALQNTQRQLQAYQRQLEGLLDNLGRVTNVATGRATAPADGTPDAAPFAPPGTPAGSMATGGGSLFGGQLQASATPRVAAGRLGNRSLTLPKGTAFTCALKTRIVSAASGMVGCQVQRNVYSDDGRVLLIERGSHLDGEYRISSVRPGTVRIPVLWTRIRTPLGVTVDVESPGTGALGESGIDGQVDNRWGERIGAAMLLSVIDDSLTLVVQNQTQSSDTSTVVLPSTTANTSKLAEKVLDSTINIPPLIYQNQGAIVGIYVARDVDFSSVYALQPSSLSPPEAAR